MRDWLPYKLAEDETLNCRWIWASDISFVHPFFDDTLSMMRRLPENRHRIHCESSLEMMKEWSAPLQSPGPSAIIFHVSRCGSTLLSQQLSLDDSNIVLAEVPFLDELLRWGFRNKQELKAEEYFTAAMKFYGRKRSGKEKRLFIKADSWHIHFHHQLRKLYPSIPFILLFRRPDEVLRSQQKQRGIQAVPGMLEPELFGLNRETMPYADLDLYMSLVLESYFKEFIEVARKDPNTILCDYADGMDRAFQSLVKACALNPGEEQMKLVNERAKFHAKKPQEEFAEPSLIIPHAPVLDKSMELYLELREMSHTSAHIRNKLE